MSELDPEPMEEQQAVPPGEPRRITVHVRAGAEMCEECRFKVENPDHDWGPQSYLCVLFGERLGILNPRRVKKCLDAEREASR